VIGFAPVAMTSVAGTRQGSAEQVRSPP